MALDFRNIMAMRPFRNMVEANTVKAKQQVAQQDKFSQYREVARKDLRDSIWPCALIAIVHSCGHTSFTHKSTLDGMKCCALGEDSYEQLHERTLELHINADACGDAHCLTKAVDIIGMEFTAEQLSIDIEELRKELQSLLADAATLPKDLKHGLDWRQEMEAKRLLRKMDSNLTMVAANLKLNYPSPLSAYEMRGFKNAVNVICNTMTETRQELEGFAGGVKEAQRRTNLHHVAVSHHHQHPGANGICEVNNDRDMLTQHKKTSSRNGLNPAAAAWQPIYRKSGQATTSDGERIFRWNVDDEDLLLPQRRVDDHLQFQQNRDSSSSECATKPPKGQGHTGVTSRSREAVELTPAPSTQPLHEVAQPSGLDQIYIPPFRRASQIDRPRRRSSSSLRRGPLPSGSAAISSPSRGGRSRRRSSTAESGQADIPQGIRQGEAPQVPPPTGSQVIPNTWVTSICGRCGYVMFNDELKLNHPAVCPGRPYFEGRR